MWEVNSPPISAYYLEIITRVSALISPPQARDTLTSPMTIMSFTNPIIPGFNPDPSIIRVDKDYFLVTSSFEYFPGVPIYHSEDLIQWKLIGHALTRPSQLQIHTPEPGGGVWAATIRYHRGVFYITAASFQRYRPQQDDRVWPQGFYVQTRNIWDESTWSDPVYFDQVGFDQDVSYCPGGLPLFSLQM